MNAAEAKRIALHRSKLAKSKQRKERLAEKNPDMMFLGDEDDMTYDDALIGVIQRGGVFVACYDYEKCIECLMATYGDGEEDPRTTAIEWMEFNVVSAYVGENGPVFFYAEDSEES